jgi:hypothetical protein
LFDEEDSSVLNIGVSKEFRLADWPIFFLHGEESLGFEDVTPLDETFSETVEVFRN